jgi:Flp pilus assembly protein TadG
MRLNKKGQALVEFVLILPVLVMLGLAAIDIGKIMLVKNHLENKTNDVITMLNENKSYQEIEAMLEKDKRYDIELSTSYDSNNYVTIKLVDKIKLMTPGLGLILGDPYPVSAERVLPYE